MNKYGSAKTVFFGSFLAIALLFGVVTDANARDHSKDFSKIQAAQARADVAYSDYMASGSSHDYKRWQHAQRRLEKRLAKIEQTSELRDSDNYSDDVGTADVEDLSVGRSYRFIRWNAERRENADNAVRVGYMYGYKRGRKDGRKDKRYNPTARIPYRDPYSTPVIAGRKYKPFYRQGYERGYADGYHGTQQYGIVYGKDAGYSIYTSEVNSILNNAG